jgi:hypothetical protein
MSRRSTGLSRNERRGVSKASLRHDRLLAKVAQRVDDDDVMRLLNSEFDAEGINQFARRNAISRRQVYEEIRAGRLIASKVGSRTIITRENAAAWRRSLPTLPATVAPRNDELHRKADSA